VTLAAARCEAMSSSLRPRRAVGVTSTIPHGQIMVYRCPPVGDRAGAAARHSVDRDLHACTWPPTTPSEGRVMPDQDGMSLRTVLARWPYEVHVVPTPTSGAV